MNLLELPWGEHTGVDSLHLPPKVLQLRGVGGGWDRERGSLDGHDSSSGVETVAESEVGVRD